MRSDDLAPLLAQPDRSDIGYHQGQILSWNAASGQNTVAMAGAVLRDVPLLNSSDITVMTEGDIVAMLRFKTTYFIVGRVIVPGTTDLFGTASVAFDGAGTTTQAFSVSTTHTTKAEHFLDVPKWCDEAVVLSTMNASVINTAASAHSIGGLVVLDGFNGGGSASTWPAGFQGVCMASAQRVIPNPTTGPQGIRVQARIVASAAMGASAGNTCNLDSIAVFRRK